MPAAAHGCRSGLASLQTSKRLRRILGHTQGVAYACVCVYVACDHGERHTKPPQSGMPWALDIKYAQHTTLHFSRFFQNFWRPGWVLLPLWVLLESGSKICIVQTLMQLRLEVCSHACRTHDTAAKGQSPTTASQGFHNIPGGST